MSFMTQASLAPRHEPPRHGKKHSLVSTALMALLVVIILATSYSLVTGVRGLRTSGQLAAHRHLRDLLTRTFTAKPDIASISDWMTFDYLNRIFKLPPTYLKDVLNITDARYPRLSIRRYAATDLLNSSAAVQDVRAAIRNYQAATPAAKP
jgi:hypothetical protein